MQDWREEWKQVVMRLNAWTKIADAFCQNHQFFGITANQARVADTLVSEAQQLTLRIRALSLPPPFKVAVTDLYNRLE